MLKIRLFRVGKKNQPFFKVVVTDKRNATRAGRFKEQVGFYNPLSKEKNFKADRIKYWLSVGAKPSDAIHNLLIKESIIKGKKAAVHSKAKKKKAEEGEAPAEAKPAKATIEQKSAEENKPDEPKPEKQKEKKPESQKKEKSAKAKEVKKK